MTEQRPDPFASVITARDVYDATRETQHHVRDAVGRIERLERDTADLQRRMTAMERWRYSLPITAISAMVAAVGAVVAALLG